MRPINWFVLLLMFCCNSCDESAASPSPVEPPPANYVPGIPVGFYRGPLGRFASPEAIADAILKIATPAPDGEFFGLQVYLFTIQGQPYQAEIRTDKRSIAVCKLQVTIICPPLTTLLFAQSMNVGEYSYNLALSEEESDACRFSVYSGIRPTDDLKDVSELLQYQWDCLGPRYVWTEIVTPDGQVYKRNEQGDLVKGELAESWARHPELIRATVRYSSPLYQFLSTELP